MDHLICCYKKKFVVPRACVLILLTRCFHLFSQGYTTMQLVCSQEMHNIGYAWKTIKEQAGEEMENHIQRMTFLKGKTVCNHNICTNNVSDISS